MHFALTLGGLESAFNAAERVNERMIDGIRYKCKTDQALLMQYMSLKCRVPEPCNAVTAKAKLVSTPIPAPSPVSVAGPSHGIKSFRDPFSEVDRDNHCVDRTYKTVPSSSFPLMLHFSTYGSKVEAERFYSSPISSDGSSFLPARRSQQHFDKSVMCCEPGNLSSAKKNDFRQLDEVISSSLFSFCYDENPSYRRNTFYSIPEVSRPAQQ